MVTRILKRVQLHAQLIDLELEIERLANAIERVDFFIANRKQIESDDSVAHIFELLQRLPQDRANLEAALASARREALELHRELTGETK